MMCHLHKGQHQSYITNIHDFFDELLLLHINRKENSQKPAFFNNQENKINTATRAGNQMNEN